MRKTVSVAKIKEFGNRILACSHNDAQGYRNAVCDMIEEVLHQADDYRGFRYLRPCEVEDGKTWGINDTDANADWELKFVGTDQTRRFYC